MITITLPAELDEVLAEMVRESGESAEQIALRALLERLEDWEDVKAAEEALREDDGVRIPLEQVMRELRQREARENAARSAAG